MTRARLVALLALALWVALVAACATNPVTGRREFSLVSPAQEVQIGKDGHAAIVQEYGRYDEPALAAYVDSVGQALAARSHQPGIEWHFTVLDDPVVNAFALPGGYIYITRGILAHMNSEAQLAGVLGHEIGHVTARHSAQRITQQQIAGLGLGIATVFVESFRPYSDAAQTGLKLMFLKWGRDDETQADELAIDYSIKSSYDAREIPATYQTLKRVGERSGQSLPSFLSTHPDPGDREVRTRQLARQGMTGKSGYKIGSRAFLERIDGIVFGADPRQGYFEGSLFVHPEFAFEIRFPAGWKIRNSAAAVVAVAPNQQAGMQLTLASTDQARPADFVQQLRTTGKIQDYQGRSETIGGFESWVGHLSVTARGGGSSTMAAAFIRKGENMFQIIGQARDQENDRRILESARSFAAVTEAKKLDVTPDRIDVARVRASATLEAILRRNGFEDPVELEGFAIVNNLRLDQQVLRGQRIKLLARGSR